MLLIPGDASLQTFLQANLRSETKERLGAIYVWNPHLNLWARMGSEYNS